MIHKKICIVAAVALVAALSVTQFASAVVIIQTDGDYQLSMSDPISVGTGAEDLYSTILSVEYLGSNDFQYYPVGFSGSISGPLHHEQFRGGPPLFPRVTTPTTALSGGSTVDSNILPTIRVTINPPSEPEIDDATSTEPGDFGPDPVNIFTGFGGPLAADVAFADANNPATNPKIDIAKLVLGNGTSFGFSFQSGSVTEGQGGTFGGEQCVGPLCITGDNTPPTLVPIVLNHDLNVDPAIVDLQLTATDLEQAVGDLAWSNLVYASGPGKNFAGATDASIDGDGLFDWNPSGWRMGTHTFNALVDDGQTSNNTTTGLVLTVNLTVPEPATFAMLGLAMVGMVGLVRRRS